MTNRVNDDRVASLIVEHDTPDEIRSLAEEVQTLRGNMEFANRSLLSLHTKLHEFATAPESSKARVLNLLRSELERMGLILETETEEW